MAATTAAQQLEQKLIDLCGEKFVQTFYTIIDSRRSDIIRMFTQNSICIYDGNAAVGLPTITHLYQLLPPCKHTVESIDIHSINKQLLTQQPNKQQSSINVNTLLITVTGTVQYGTDSRVHLYHHTFIVDKCDPNKPNIHYIVYAVFRSRVGDSKADRAQQQQQGKRIRA